MITWETKDTIHIRKTFLGMLLMAGAAWMLFAAGWGFINMPSDMSHGVYTMVTRDEDNIYRLNERIKILDIEIRRQEEMYGITTAKR